MATAVRSLIRCPSPDLKDQASSMALALPATKPISPPVSKVSRAEGETGEARARFELRLGGRAVVDLSIVFLLTMGGPVGATSVLGFEGFQTGIVSGDVSHGAAISLFMLPVLLVVVILMLRFIRRREI